MSSKLQTKKDACRCWLMKILYFLCAESHTGGGPKRIAVRPVKGIIKKLNYMMKKKIFMPLLGAVVLGMSAYAGYRTYDAYNGVSESDLLLANAEALAIQEFMGCDCNRSTRTCRVYVGAKGKVKLLGGTILEAGANGYVEFDGEVICSKGGEGSTCCTMVECIDIYEKI